MRHSYAHTADSTTSFLAFSLFQASPNCFSAVCTNISAIASDDVAAGEGALRTYNTPVCPSTMKSSSSVPSGASACALTPDGPGSRSAGRRSGR